MARRVAGARTDRMSDEQLWILVEGVFHSIEGAIINRDRISPLVPRIHMAIEAVRELRVRGVQLQLMPADARGTLVGPYGRDSS